MTARRTARNLPGEAAPVRIRITRNFACAAAALVPEIAAVLQCLKREFVATEAGTIASELTRLENYTVIDDEVVFPAGLAARVVRHLEQAGHHVELDDRPLWPQAGEDELEARLRAPGREFVAALRGARRGQIVVPGKAAIPRLAALIGRLYPRENAFIVAKNRKRIGWLTARLRRIAGRFVTDDLSEAWLQRPRVFIGTIDDFWCAGSQDWQLAVFADVESATARPSVSTVGRLEALVFAFREAGERLDERREMDLEAVAGPVIFRAASAKRPARRVAVETVRAVGYPAADPRWTALERKRRLFWYNVSRNRQVADLATALAAGDRQRLAQLDVTMPAEIGIRPSVAIVTETAEHAHELARLLPDATVNDAKVERDPGPAVIQLPAGSITIATMLRAKIALAASVILLTHGTGTPWDEVFGGAEPIHRDAAVVDVGDDCDERAIWDTRQRRQDYASHGWSGNGSG